MESITDNLEAGDFINLKDWFGDVWAEVLDPGVQYVSFCQYSKDGNSRWSRMENKDSIRKVVKKAERESLMKQYNVLHFADLHFGSRGLHEWDHPLTADMHYGSNHPERREI